MRTARRLFVVHFIPCLLTLAFLVTPAAAQRTGQLLTQRDSPHPTLGSITDDPGPFNRFVWGPETEVNHRYVPPGVDEGQVASVAGDPPTVKFNPVSGYPIAVWTAAGHGSAAAQGRTVFFSHFTVGGWTGPTLLAEGAQDPSLSIDPVDGRVHLVYWTPDDGGPGTAVWHRQAPADLTSWSDPIRVSDFRESAARPTALVHRGTLRIAYESHVSGPGSTPREIVVVERGLTTEPTFSRTVLAMTDYAGRNWVRLDSDGRRLLVRWVNAEHQAGWALQGENGAWGPVGLQPMLRTNSDAEGSRRVRPRR